MPHKALSILIICLLYGSLASSFLASSQAELSLMTETGPYESIQANEKSFSSDASELLTFTNYLTAYNVSAESEELIFVDNQTLREDGVMTHVCSYKIPSKADSSSIFCSLISFNIDQNSDESVQVINLYLNESQQTILESQDAIITYKDVPSELIFQTSNTTTKSKCKTDAIYSFINIETMMPFDYVEDTIENFSVTVTLSGGDCGYEINTPLMTTDEESDDDSQMLTYVGIMVAFGLIHMLACERLIKRVERNPVAARGTSLGSLSMLLVFDFYLYLTHFKAWADDDSDWLAAVFITFFMVAIFFEPALMFYVFNSVKNRRDRPVLDVLYELYFWVSIAGTCLVLSLTCAPNCLYYAFPCFLVPQIMDTFNSEKRYRWNLWLLIGLGLPKILFIGYINYVPDNPVNDYADPVISIIAGGIFLIQLIVLAVQTRLPKLGFQMKLFNSYSYTCKGEDRESVSTEICSICTETVSEVPLIGNIQSLLVKEDMSGVMKTPCSHYFHDECLKEWIKKKLECPNCRQAVPPLDDEDY